MDIYLTLSKILSYLPISDLKAARAVNAFWNSVSLPQFKQGTKLKLNISFNTETDSQKLIKFTEEMIDSSLYENLELKVDKRSVKISPQNLPTLSHFEYAHYFITKVLKPQLKILNLQMFIENLEDGELFLNILQHFSSTLKNISIKLHLFQGDSERLIWLLHFKETIQLPKLLGLKVFISVEKGDPQLRLAGCAENSQKFFAGFFKAAPNIEKLGIDWVNTGIFPLLENPTILRKLKKLKYSLCSHMETNILLESERSFNWLEIGTSSIKGYGRQLELLMEKNRFCLEHLKLHFGLIDPNKPVFELPTFTNLKSLNLSFFADKDAGIRFIFPGNVIQYSRDLPSLKSFFIKYAECGYSFVCLKDVYDSFFPTQKQKCSSLELLKILKICGFLNSEKYYVGWDLENGKNLHSMFPLAKIVLEEKLELTLDDSEHY